MTDGKTDRGRWVLVAVALIFAVPTLLVWLWTYLETGWQPGKTTNYGSFINPQRVINGAPLLLPLAGGKLKGDYLKGRWTMVYIGPANCNPDCKEVLYVTRQVRLATGNDIRRVQRLYLVRGIPADPDYLRKTHPDLTVAEVDSKLGEAYVKQFSDATNGNYKGRIYLVDPLGDLMMVYPAQADPEGLLKDLRRLLKNSSIG